MHLSKDVGLILSKKYQVHRSKLGLFWGCLNFTLALICYVDLNGGAMSSYLMSYSPAFWYLELGLASIFTLNFLSDICGYLWLWCSAPVKATNKQLNLLGIGSSAEGFQAVPDSTTSTQPQTSPPSGILDPTTFFASSTPRHSASQSPANTWLSSSNLSSLGQSPSNSVSPASASTTASSWTYFDDYSAAKLRKSFFNRSSSSPLNAEDVVINEKSFQRYLKDAEEQKLCCSLHDTSPASVLNLSNSPFWRQSSPASTDASGGMNLSTMKLSYQLSTRSPQSSSSRAEDTDSGIARHGEIVWSKIGVSFEQVFSWTENLRKWLCRTILSRVVAEMDSINESLRRQGMPDVQIGEVNLSVLKQRAKSSQIPSLYVILQYLDITPNQEYLVQRLRDLEKGGCLSDFRWNGGATFKGKPWSDSLPTDSCIVMHLLFTYLDSRSPLHTSFPEGRPVSARHFCKSPDKPDATSKDTLCVYQTNVNPPHYKLIVGDEVWELPKGRNNMFHVILLFLYHIKTKEDCMINHVNLGPSGLNMMWIIDD